MMDQFIKFSPYYIIDIYSNLDTSDNNELIMTSLRYQYFIGINIKDPNLLSLTT